MRHTYHQCVLLDNMMPTTATCLHHNRDTVEKLSIHLRRYLIHSGYAPSTSSGRKEEEKEEKRNLSEKRKRHKNQQHSSQALALDSTQSRKLPKSFTS